MIENYDQELERIYHPENFETVFDPSMLGDEQLLALSEADHGCDGTCSICQEVVKRGMIHQEEN